MWFTDRHFFLLAVVIYGVSTLYSIFLWRKGFRRHDRASYLLLLVGFLAHTTAMLLRGLLLHACPVRNLYEATAFVGWTIVAAGLVLGLWPRLRFVSAFASPLLFGIGVFALIMPGLDTPHATRPELPVALTSLHATLALLAFGTFGLSAVSGTMYLTQERDLKLNKLRAVSSHLPPLQRLESITSRSLLAGAVLLTVGLGIGGQLPRPDGVSYLQDAKVIWSLFLWLLYAGLLVWRWRFAQTGRRFACAAIGAFAFVLLTFWGTNLLSPLHHP